ncbi:hypothetical protein [Bacillus wiedmannii]|uniref:Uncharacterized protein n=1 Tax=Bacillus wiedmannii TaxID=1890302 RepID=A0A2A8BSI4_9BACI|nr:hypothetical protein [Bacillus wiedmannii]PEM57622.1 hypothetical protein CN611_07360 [Bacillus wiedmannii]
MKIEVGDIVNTTYSRSVEVLDITPDACNESKHRVWFINDFGDKINTFIRNCTLVKKGEKKMKTYTGFEAYKALLEGKVLELGAVSKQLYKMMGAEGDTLYTKRKNEDAWSYCNMELNFFMSREFTEYKEPLKYKVGDEVWVKAKVIQIDEVSNNLPYRLDLGEDYTAWFEENEVKGIDE